MNDIIHRALSSAHVPSRLEPTGLSHSDASHPDDIAVVPWKYGRLLACDATCPDTFAPSYISSATSQAGAVAALAEERKRSKYLLLNHLVVPVAIEMSGVIGPLSMAFLRELGQRLRHLTGEGSSTAYLLQKLSIAVQRGNAASVLGTSGHSASVEDLFL